MWPDAFIALTYGEVLSASQFWHPPKSLIRQMIRSLWHETDTSNGKILQKLRIKAQNVKKHPCQQPDTGRPGSPKKAERTAGERNKDAPSDRWLTEPGHLRHVLSPT